MTRTITIIAMAVLLGPASVSAQLRGRDVTDLDASNAGLYLWVRPEAGDQDSWSTVGDLASLGLLVAPGAFYGAPRQSSSSIWTWWIQTQFDQ